MQKPSIGRIVHYAPPQECVGAKTLECYGAMITQVHPVWMNLESRGEGEPTHYLCDLVTFGPNSVYFQHKVQHAEEPKPGFWCWPPRV